MAVTITRADLRDALRLADDQDTTDEIDRILAYATEVATKLVPVCPDVVHNESVVRLASYLFDQPSVSRGAAYANAMRNSGAGSILAPYRVRRAGNVGGSVVGATPVTDPAVAPDMSPTDTDALMRAIADYLADNPIETEKGDKGDKGDDSTVPGPRGAASTVPGPRGAASTIPGPRGLPSTVPGPRGLPSMVPGPRGPASTVAGPRGPGPTDVELASAVADYATANPSGGARTVDQIGGNVEPDGSFGNGHWLAFELQTGQTIADTDLLEFEITQTSTNKRVGITLTGRAFNALPDTAVAPRNGAVPNGAYALRIARVFENSTTQFGHAQATVTKTTGTATTIYLTGSHSSFWRNGIVRCWRTT